MKVIVEFDCIEDAVKAVSALNQQSEVKYEPIRKSGFQQKKRRQICCKECLDTTEATQEDCFK